MGNLTVTEKLVLEKIKSRSQNLKKLSKSLNISGKELKTILSKLERELLIKESNGIYIYTMNDNYRVGTLKITRRKSGVIEITPEEVYYISEKDLKNAVDGDTVLIKIIDKLKHSAVVEDKKEEERKLVGTIYIKNKRYFVKADNPSFTADLKLVKPPTNIHNNDKVYVSFKTLKNTTSYKVKEIEVLGNKYSVGVDIISIIKELGIEEEFSLEAQTAAESLKNYVDEEDLKDRVDLRSEKIFTIDGKNSEDFDDAIGITILDNNHLLVKVCIADVDHYVSENSLLDQIAINRTSSIYLIDRTLPMLPTIISNGICSLKPNEDRLTLTYELEYDIEGNLIRYNIYPSVICSKQRMNYLDVEDVLTNPSSEMYKEFQTDLRLLESLRKKIREKRIQSGYISRDEKKRRIFYDHQRGKITNVTTTERLNSSSLIEEYMIATNICASLFAKEQNIPIIYRIQDDEPKKVIKQRLEILKKMGFEKVEFQEEASNNEIIKNVLSAYKDHPYIEFINAILMNRNRGYYSNSRNHHSNLNEEYYAHFTSPIRRYSDLYSSRQIKKYLKKQKREQDNSEILEHINQKNSDIKICISRVEGLKLGEYYANKNKAMPATIIGINQERITVQLDDSTTGVIFRNNLKGYHFDYEKYQYQNKNSVLKLGDRILIELNEINRYKGTTNYKIYQKK